MKISRIIPFLFGLIILIFFLESCTEPADDRGKKNGSIPSQTEITGTPDFELPDLEGQPFRLSSSRGNPVLLVFSTTWCAYCRSELPHFRGIHDRYSPRSLEVVQIFIQESRQKVSSFARQYNLPYRVLLDEKGEVAEAYGVRGVPDMILLDRNGRVLCRHCPNLDASLENLFGNPQPDQK